MKNRFSLYALLIAILITIAPPLAAKEYLDWNVDGYVLAFKENNGWKGIGGEETFSLIYKKPEETSENWTEKLEIVNLPIAITLGGKVHWNPESILNAPKLSECSDITIINKTKKSILYERKNINCPGFLHNQEIGRIVMGKWYLWWISHGTRNKVLSSEAKDEVINFLKKARIGKANKNE